MEVDYGVYPPQVYVPTKRGERAMKGQCLGCRTKWTAVGEPVSCPVCAISNPDPIAEHLKATRARTE